MWDGREKVGELGNRIYEVHRRKENGIKKMKKMEYINIMEESEKRNKHVEKIFA